LILKVVVAWRWDLSSKILSCLFKAVTCLIQALTDVYPARYLMWHRCMIHMCLTRMKWRRLKCFGYFNILPKATTRNKFLLLPPFLFISRWIVQFYTIQRLIKRNRGSTLELRSETFSHHLQNSRFEFCHSRSLRCLKE
jgi:hypothetical protein